MDECETALLHKASMFRLELDDPNFSEKNTSIQIDGEIYEATKVQGYVMEHKVYQAV